MEDPSDPRYINMRVPRSEYDKLKETREELQKNPNYSWVGNLALGAFIGLVAGMVLKEITESDKD